MLYQTWNLRIVPIFEEEMPEQDLQEQTYPSIKGFQQTDVYPAGLRTQLVNYIQNSQPLVATTLKRYNPYQQQFHMGLMYYTDGEVIFNNFLIDYIQHDDFAIPALWLAIIRNKNFKVDPFVLDFDLITTGKIDVFETAHETFDELPILKKAMKV